MERNETNGRNTIEFAGLFFTNSEHVEQIVVFVSLQVDF